MSERIYKLLNGSELICSEEGILSHRLEPDFTAITTDPNAEYMDLLALIDSLQQQVNGLNEESLANFQTAAERGKQLAERDRTIAVLELESKGHKALKGYAKILLSFIEPDGTPVDSYSFREIAKELRTTVTALGE
ncbi:hypothetical protein H6F38_04775 [Paenibacillus sp. EKM208P]|nr:hypothetical protein H6F38_04775 [Paenibacillus sp. EKM208P]